MHSRIFQVSNESIAEEDFIRESRYDEETRFDYVVTSKIAEDLKWLSNVKGLKIDVEARTITLISKEKYFKRAYYNFLKLMEELHDASLNEFANDSLRLKVYELKQSYEDTIGFYIDDNGEEFGLVTLDEWVRGVEEGRVAHVGQTFDYHF